MTMKWDVYSPSGEYLGKLVSDGPCEWRNIPVFRLIIPEILSPLEPLEKPEMMVSISLEFEWIRDRTGYPALIFRGEKKFLNELNEKSEKYREYSRMLRSWSL